MKIREIMTKKPIVAEVPGTRADVLKILVKHNITGVPVVKRSDGKLAGFVTRQDIFAKPEEDQLALIMRKDYPAISSEDDVSVAAKHLVENDIHHLPVIDKDRLVGIVTSADLLIAVEDADLKTPIVEFIRSPCVPVYEGTPLTVASEIIKVCSVYALPVLNDRGRLSGIITDRDIFNLSVIDGRVAISDLGLGEDEDAWTWEGFRNIMKLYYETSKINLPKKPVKEVMIKKPMTVFEKTGVSETARIMRKNDFGQLPVRDSKDGLLGMVYELDVLVALLK